MWKYFIDNYLTAKDNKKLIDKKLLSYPNIIYKRSGDNYLFFCV